MITSSTPANDVATLLSTLGYGTIATDIFVWQAPDSPDNIITVYDVTISEPEINYTYDRHSVQIMVRRKRANQDESRLRLLQIMSALHGYVGSVGGVSYHLIKVTSGPLDIGEDDKGRLRWTINLEIQRS
jgi:hypothetical protein